MHSRFVSLAWLLLFGLTLGLVPLPAHAQDSDTASIDIHYRDSDEPIPIKAVQSHTIIDGPVARTQISYVAANSSKEAIEAVVNLHVPPGTVLHGFGYYYKGRFISGKMYDNDEAWRIYEAVTSRGRDPGVMDRPTDQDYHAQIFPVEGGHDLRVVIQLSQSLAVSKDGTRCEIPMSQALSGKTPVQVHADAWVRRHGTSDLSSNESGRTTITPEANGSHLTLAGLWRPTQNWRILVRRSAPGVTKSVYSALSDGKGYFAVTLAAPYPLKNPHVELVSSPGTNYTLPTRFGSTQAHGGLTFVGTYRRPQTLHLMLISQGHAPLQITTHLSGKTAARQQNPAAILWADKRISLLQTSPGRDRRPQIVRLSREFMVVSQFTALLAIPAEELANYRKVLAHQNISTNTRYTGGGGGDPYIAVKAPADSQQVVAVFPDGTVKDLTWNAAKGVWDGRFDIPFGTPEGDYGVTVIVVHHDGQRSRFLLVYQNLKLGPKAVTPNTLAAAPGADVPIKISGTGIARAVAVAPWGERVTLNFAASTSDWQGALHIPADWPQGKAPVTVILLDGAHDRTEVTLDLDVH